LSESDSGRPGGGRSVKESFLMRSENEGLQLWIEEADSPRGVVKSGAHSVTIAVAPVDTGNHVDLLYRIDSGATCSVHAKWLRNDAAGKVQYFRATFPDLPPGVTVEYTAVCHCAGRRVSESEPILSSFRVAARQQVSSSSFSELQPSSEDSEGVSRAPVPERSLRVGAQDEEELTGRRQGGQVAGDQSYVVGDVLDSVPPGFALTKGQREALMAGDRVTPGSGSELLSAAGTAGLAPLQLAALRSTVAIADLSSGDLDVVRALQRRLPEEPEGSLVHLASMTPNEWITVTAEAKPDAPMLEIERAAAALAAAVERQHPSSAFLAKMRDGVVDVDGYPVAKVAAFLESQPDFDLNATSVEPFLIEHHLPEDRELKTAVLAIQRVLNLGATQMEAVEVIRAGLSSALDVFSAGLEPLKSSLGGRVDPARIETLYGTAYELVSATVGVASIISPALSGPAIPALADSQDFSTLLTRFPSLQAIFGDLSTRRCAHCASVLGPAAYLVDLLNTLRRAGVEGELRLRRPDIAQLELTCENTCTEMQYADLALEVMENAVAFPSASVWLTAAEHDLLDAGSVPEPVLHLLETTVSSMDGDITVLGSEDFADEQEITFVQGHRRWAALHTREGIIIRRGSSDKGPTLPDTNVDVVRDALRRGSAAAELLAVLAPEPRLPVIGTPTVTMVPPEPGASNDQRERYRVHGIREVAVALGWSGSGPAFVTLERLDGGAIHTDLLSDASSFVKMLADEFGEGRLPQYIANWLPWMPAYEVRPDQLRPDSGRWIVSAEMDFRVTYNPGWVNLTGLAYTGSASTAAGTLATFPENRNPAAYAVLRDAPYPWSLPFDVFTEEVRACLQPMGTSRLALIRALRPGLRNASVLDACEILRTTPGQIRQITGPDPTKGSSAFWGLTGDGNIISEPTGDTGAPPIAGDWTSALSRLSVILQRSGVPLPTLLGSLASRYVTGGVAPALLPPQENKPSRLTVRGLTEPVLSRLHRFLRLRLITGWSLRDLDLALDMVTDKSAGKLTEDAAMALAALHELAARLDVPLRHAAAWVGGVETRQFTDREVDGEPIMPSLYDEIFIRTAGQTADPDLRLGADRTQLTYITEQTARGVDPRELKLKTLTDKIPPLSRALGIRPSDVAAFVDGPKPVVPDILSLANIDLLVRHVTYARAAGLAVSEYLRLCLLTGEDLFAAAAGTAAVVRARRLLRFCDLVEDIRATGFTLDQLTEAVGAPISDPSARREMTLDLHRVLADLQAGLRAAGALNEDPTEAGIRGQLTAAGWPSEAVDQVITGGPGSVGLASTPEVRVTITSVATPKLPAGLPFMVKTAETQGEFLLTARVDALAGGDPDSEFAGLAAVAGLGPLTDPTSPAARLHAEWDALQAQVLRLATWLQSIELPVTRQEFTFTGSVPPLLRDATRRLHYDPAGEDLVLVGYLDPSELASLAALPSQPRFAEAVRKLANKADEYKEKRGGSRLMSCLAVRNLILGEASPQARYAILQQAIATPARRRHLVQLAASRFAIDPRLFTALDDAAQLASPSADALAPLSSANFAGADLQQLPADGGTGKDEEAAWMAAAAELRRVGQLISVLRVRPSEQPWFGKQDGFAGLATLGFGQATGLTLAQKFHAWRQATSLYRLRSVIPAQAATLEATRVAAGSATTVDAVLAIVEQAYQLPPESAAALRLDGLVTHPADLRDPMLLRRVIDAAQTLRRLGATSGVALRLCQAELTEADTRDARGLFAVKYGPDAASEGLRTAMNAVRERQRTALVDYLIHRDGAVDAADLHARYLLDVEMGPDMRTSRIKQAISSTQLFIQRWLLNVESPYMPAPSKEFAHAWEWTRNYRVWEANRRVFLFPEAFLEPSLRDDKSHLFAKLESALLQSELTSEQAVEGLLQYLDGLEEMSRITVMAMYRETVEPRAGTVHVVGRTQNHPARYFYRQWHNPGAAGFWDPWEPLEVVGDTDHLVVFVRNGRPHIAWLAIDNAQPADTPSGGNTGSAAGTAGPTATATHWAIQLMWSRRNHDGWSAPRKSAETITHQKAINKDPRTTFALRIEPVGPSGPVIRCYGGSTDGSEPMPDPVPLPPHEVMPGPLRAAGWTVASIVPGFPPLRVEQRACLVQVQVLGKIGARHVALDAADVEIWATVPGIGLISPFIDGTAEAPRRLTHMGGGLYQTEVLIPAPYCDNPNPLTVTVRATFARVTKPESRTQEEKQDVLLSKNNAARFGLVFDNLDSTIAGIDPDRRLKLFPIAAGDWGLSSGLRWRRDGTRQSASSDPVLKAEHYRSGFRFPANKRVKFHTTLLYPPPPEPVLLTAAATDISNQLTWPYYVEAEFSGAGGFITRTDKGEDAKIWEAKFCFLSAAEHTHDSVLRRLDADLDTLELAAGSPANLGAADRLPIAEAIEIPYRPEDPQFARALPYAGYVWEVFFHAPMMIAHGLTTQQRHGEALRWLHTVFDPTARDGNGQRQWWRFPPFADAGQGTGIDLLLEGFSAGKLGAEQLAAFQAQLDFSQTSPFRPHGIARMRVRAYQWMVVLQYLKVLIAWGDQQFRRDTIESINEATQLYLLAAELLGQRPTEMPPRNPAQGPPTFAGLAGRWDDFSNAWVSLADTPFFKELVAWLQYLAQRGMGPGSPAFDTATERLRLLLSTQPLTFCVPRNEQLDQYWDRVEDRLAKIRSSQTIEGVRRRLALFEPPIDPGLLVRAVAARLDISSVLNETFAPPTPYRFSLALQLAEEFCVEVRGLGATLLSALEKRDAEDLARLRSSQELAILELVGDHRQRQLDEATATLTALRQSRASAEVRYRHYQRLLGKEQIQTPAENEPVEMEAPKLQLGTSTSDRVDPDLRGYGLTLEEADHLGWLNVGNTYTLLGGAFQTTAGILHAFPDFSLGTPWAQSKFGGSHLGNAAGAIGQFFSTLANNASFQSTRSSIIGGHQRRYDDWVLQSNIAGKELEQIDKQILTAEIRVDLVKKEITQHARQVEHAKSVDEFMREKFTTLELYQWMTDRLSEAHSAAYQLAYDLARKAQRSFAFELGEADPGIITSAGWDGAHRGLLASERLSLDLKRLKAAYAERNRRELEVTKTVSLSMLDPIALLRLQATGSCEFTIPELAYDLDFPGHYFRRIKTVAVSLPCVVGPYTSVAGTLTLLENSLRASPLVPKGTDPPDYRRDVVPIQSIAISGGSTDSGMFELNFRDERYLRFEGAGAISKWRFELPTEFRAFDYASITDLVLRVSYTARDGGEQLKADATDRVRKTLETQNSEIIAAGEEGRLVRAASLPHEFPSEWARLQGPRTSAQTISIGTDRFPFLLHDRNIQVWKLTLYLRGAAIKAGEDPPLTVTAPSEGYSGPEPGPPAIPWVPVDTADGVGLYEFALKRDDVDGHPWKPFTIKADEPQSLTLELPASSPRLSDAVLAFWWQLASEREDEND
jgi:hypothetical protein